MLADAINDEGEAQLVRGRAAANDGTAARAAVSSASYPRQVRGQRKDEMQRRFCVCGHELLVARVQDEPNVIAIGCLAGLGTCPWSLDRANDGHRPGRGSAGIEWPRPRREPPDDRWR